MLALSRSMKVNRKPLVLVENGLHCIIPQYVEKTQLNGFSDGCVVDTTATYRTVEGTNFYDGGGGSPPAELPAICELKVSSSLHSSVVDSGISSPGSAFDETCDSLRLRISDRSGSESSPRSPTSPSSRSSSPGMGEIICGMSFLSPSSSGFCLDDDAQIVEMDDSGLVGSFDLFSDRLLRGRVSDEKIRRASTTDQLDLENNVKERDPPRKINDDRWNVEVIATKNVEVINIYGPQDTGLWWSDQVSSGSELSSFAVTPTLGRREINCQSGKGGFVNRTSKKSRRKKKKKAALSRTLTAEESPVEEEEDDECCKKPRRFKKLLRNYYKHKGERLVKPTGDRELELNKWHAREEKSKISRSKEKDKRQLKQRFCKKDAISVYD